MYGRRIDAFSRRLAGNKLKILYLSCLLWVTVASYYFGSYASCKVSYRFQSSKSFEQTQVAAFYVFSPTSETYVKNFIYFYNFAVTASQNGGFSTDYFLISNNLEGKADLTISSLLEHCPTSPKNVQIFEKENNCFDLGSIGWLLEKDGTILERYNYYIWVNASVRGPFLVPYAGIHWTEPFIRKRTGEVKLVGPSINCGCSGADASAKPYPHVQSFVSATDRDGINILYQRGIFSCHQIKIDAVENGEIMASRVLMEMNFSIASLMANQDIQWSSDTNTASCNSLKDPMQSEYQMGGVPVQIEEVVFVKVRLDLTLPSLSGAEALSSWKSKEMTCLRDLLWFRRQSE